MSRDREPDRPDRPRRPRRAHRPPVLARWLLRRILPADERERIVADLDDFHRQKWRGGNGGRTWYWRQVAGYAVRTFQLRPPGRPAGIYLVREVRGAVRSLARTPAVTVPAVVTIALALGVNAAVFAVVDALLLAPLPYQEPAGIVQVWLEDPSAPEPGPGRVSARAWERWLEGDPPADGLGAYRTSTATLLGVGDPTDVSLVHVEPDLLQRLGPAPVLGRAPDPDPGGGVDPEVLLSHTFWRTHLAGDPDVVGRWLDLAGTPHRVVGVARPGFRLPLDREVAGWARLEFDMADYRFLADLPLMSALAWWDGPEANGRARTLGESLQALLPDAAADGRWSRVRVESLEALARPAGTALPVLFAAVTMVLLLACLNVAQLLLARGAKRAPELAVRTALGAGPWTLRWMLVAEGVLLAAAGTLLATGVARLLLDLFIALDPGHLPGWADVHLGPRAIAYMGGAAVATAALLGLLPSPGRSGRGGVAASAPGRGTGTRGTLRLQRGLLSVQTALTLVLLTGTALLLRSWAAVQAVDPGFEPRGVHVARVVLPPDRYPPGDGAAHVRFFQELGQALRRHPQIGDATVATALPAAPGLDFTQAFVPEGSDPAGAVRITTRTVGPGYFETLDVPVLAGRIPGAGDAGSTERIVVLNRSAARLLLGTSDPEAAVSRRVVELREGAMDPPSRVVGVVADVREAGPDRPPEPMVLAPWLQSRPFGRMWIAARPAVPGTAVWDAVRAALRDVDPHLPLVDASRLEERMASTVAPRRFNLFLLGTLGGLALLMSVVGMAGLAGFVASGLRRQVAIRVALGAGTARALAPAVAGPLLAVLVGLVVGLAGVVTMSRGLRSLLFGVTPLDTWSVAGSLLLLTAVAVATVVPRAWRTGRTDPREVLDGG